MDRRQFLSFAALAGLSMKVTHAEEMSADTSSWRKLPKALWVWRTPLTEASVVADFAARWGFESLFYSVPPVDRASLYGGARDALAAMAMLRADGRRLFAVAGDPQWCLTGSNMPDAITQLIAFSARYPILDGICLDVEPQGLQQWQEYRTVLLEGYEQFLSTVRAHLHMAHHPTTLYATVIPAYNNVQIQSENALEVLSRSVDGLVLMAYRSQPDQALNVSRRSLSVLEQVGKPWWFGVTVGEHAKPGIGYAQAGRNVFLQDTIFLSDTLSSHQGYTGLAIHDYLGLRHLLETNC